MRFFALVLAFGFGVCTAQQDRTASMWSGIGDALTKRADELYHSGEWESCVPILKMLRSMYPDDESVASDLVFMLKNNDRKDEALKEAIRYRNEHPKSVSAANDLALIYFQEKLYARIPPVLEPFVKISSNIESFTMLGRSYEELGLPGEALRIWSERAKRLPSDPISKKNVDRLRRQVGGAG
jgi:hypothetical protein